jgi:hypothetical protein
MRGRAEALSEKWHGLISWHPEASGLGDSD